jgi:hypothetical protein
LRLEDLFLVFYWNLNRILLYYYYCCYFIDDEGNKREICQRVRKHEAKVYPELIVSGRYDNLPASSCQICHSQKNFPFQDKYFSFEVTDQKNWNVYFVFVTIRHIHNFIRCLCNNVDQTSSSEKGRQTYFEICSFVLYSALCVVFVIYTNTRE